MLKVWRGWVLKNVILKHKLAESIKKNYSFFLFVAKPEEFLNGVIGLSNVE